MILHTDPQSVQGCQINGMPYFTSLPTSRELSSRLPSLPHQSRLQFEMAPSNPLALQVNSSARAWQTIIHYSLHERSHFDTPDQRAQLLASCCPAQAKLHLPQVMSADDNFQSSLLTQDGASSVRSPKRPARAPGARAVGVQSPNPAGSGQPAHPLTLSSKTSAFAFGNLAPHPRLPG